MYDCLVLFTLSPPSANSLNYYHPQKGVAIWFAWVPLGGA